MADETFSSDWLALREPADHRSRSTDLIAPLAEWWAARTGRHVLDLGSGTGSNLRYLAPRLPGEQAWTLVDRDAALLDRATSAGVTSPGVGRVEPDSETVPEGLGSGTVPGRSGSGAVPRGHDSGTVPTGVGSEVVALECVVGELDPEGLVRVPEADLVTASALLDLVTHQWLERLVEACRAAGNAALLSLTWDGTMTWGHPDRNDHPAADAEKPADGLVAEAVRDHQLRDKGMGPALGPAAGPAAAAACRAAGSDTWLLSSPWRLGAGDELLARALIDGWVAAASEERPADAQFIRDWAERRRASTSTGFTLEVGHVDLLALPPGPVDG